MIEQEILDVLGAVGGAGIGHVSLTNRIGSRRAEEIDTAAMAMVRSGLVFMDTGSTGKRRYWLPEHKPQAQIAAWVLRRLASGPTAPKALRDALRGADFPYPGSRKVPAVGGPLSGAIMDLLDDDLIVYDGPLLRLA